MADTMTDNDAARDAVVVERSFDAPVHLIWQMWTESEHFRAWYGPTGAAIPIAKMDVRVGGTRLVCMEMSSPGGSMQMWFTGEYIEVVEDKRLVYTESISDEHGRVPSGSETSAAHAMTTVVRVDLQDVGGRTRMVMTHTGVPGDSPGATGWVMALDKLSAYLATIVSR